MDNISTQRDYSIDIAKGFAILLVILGHNPFTPHIIRVWLMTFHMALFFVCSGMLFNPNKYDNFKSFLISRIKKLVIPYLCLAFAMWLLIFIRYNILDAFAPGYNVSNCKGLLDAVKSIILANRGHHDYFTMWFVCAMFCVQVAFYLVHKLTKEKWWTYVIILFAGLIVQWGVSNLTHGVYWSIDLVPAGLAFFSLGYMLNSTKAKNINFYNIKFLPIAVVASLGLAWLQVKNGYSFVWYDGKMVNPLLTLLTSLSGCWLTLIVSKNIGRSKILEYFGKNSLIVYAFNYDFAINTAKMIVQFLIARSARFDEPITKWLIVQILAMLFCAVLVEIINRFFPWMTGKPFRRKKPASIAKDKAHLLDN